MVSYLLHKEESQGLSVLSKKMVSGQTINIYRKKHVIVTCKLQWAETVAYIVYLHVIICWKFELLILCFWLRMVCPGEGLPPNLIQDMFHSSRWMTQEGLGLSMCRKILKLINGEVQYIRESERCYFLISIELPVPRRGSKSVD